MAEFVISLDAERPPRRVAALVWNVVRSLAFALAPVDQVAERGGGAGDRLFVWLPPGVWPGVRPGVLP
jgi:hypothetical protein